MIIPQEVIRRKRDGLALTNAEIAAFVDGLVDGSFNDAQAGSMAMAIFQRGMDTNEIVQLTQSMMHSGEVLSWPELEGPIVDKHSTGGVGDKVSFMLAAIVAACGAYIPMISGRGLGHTGGTADKLESIPGFIVQPSTELFRKVVAQQRMAIITQTNSLAPADKRLYGIRDITATVESVPLITASILSKKLAAGLGSLVMDIKYGNGATMSNMADARLLGQTIVDVATAAGVPTEAIITDMNQPLGTTVGNAVEMIETIEYLTTPQRDARLHEVVSELAISMLKSSGIEANRSAALAKIESVLNSGLAAEYFAKMISALGGPIDLLEKPEQYLPKANVIVDIPAPQSGYLSAIDTRAVGVCVVGMKGGRTAPGQAIDHSVGFDRVMPLGSSVQKGEVIARIHASTNAMAEAFSQRYIQTLTFSDSQVELAPTIYQTLKPTI